MTKIFGLTKKESAKLLKEYGEAKAIADKYAEEGRRLWWEKTKWIFENPNKYLELIRKSWTND